MDFIRNLKNQNLSSFSIVIRSIKILETKDFRKFIYVIGIYMALGVLDIMAVFVLGLVGSLTISGVASSEPGSRVSSLLMFFGLSDNTLQFQVAILGTLAASVLVFRSLASMFLSKMVLLFFARRSADLSEKLLNKMFENNLESKDDKSIQESIYALTTGVNAVTNRILGSSLILVSDAFLILALSLSLFIVDTLIALSSLLLFGLVGLWLYVFFHKQAETMGKLTTKLHIESGNMISDLIQTYRELLVRNRRNYYKEKITSSRLKVAEAEANMKFLSILSKYIIELTMVFGAIGIGAAQFITQPATRAVAGISIFLIAASRIAPAVLRLQTNLIGIRGSIGSAAPTLNLIEDFLKLENKVDKKISRPSSNLNSNYPFFEGTIEVENLTFIYPGTTTPAINNVSFRVSAGEFVGIVGHSGAGKSTLVDLILGIYSPQGGSTKISGLMPREAFVNWPGQIAYVPQDTSIVRGTIKQNVCLGFDENQFSDSFIEQIIKHVELDEILRSPKGIHTAVGENGSKLSGGQKQRLGIARALLTNPSILILDEATSALDSLTEQRLSAYLSSLRGSITLLVIAHRLSTIRTADKLIYLATGQKLGEGTFDELKTKFSNFEAQAKAMGIH